MATELEDRPDYVEFTIEIVPPIAFATSCSTLLVHKDAANNFHVSDNGYAEEYVQKLIDEYVHKWMDELVVQITNTATKQIDRFYPYGKNHWLQYCKDCIHAEMLPEGYKCHLKSPDTPLNAAPMPKACSLFKPRGKKQ